MTYPKMTKTTIEELANKVIEIFCQKQLAGDTSFYFNNKVIRIQQKFDKDFNATYIKEETDNVDPHNYFEYAAYDHILSMSFEGFFYEYMDMHFQFPDECEKLFKEYGIYWELGEQWNCSFYPIDEDETRIEYTKYTKPVEPQYIHIHSFPCDSHLVDIMQDWYAMSKQTGDKGGCVIGAYMAFEYNGIPYHMAPCSPWQGEGSWTSHVNYVINRLKTIGATNIHWNYGRLD